MRNDWTFDRVRGAHTLRAGSRVTYKWPVHGTPQAGLEPGRGRSSPLLGRTRPRKQLDACVPHASGLTSAFCILPGLAAPLALARHGT